MTNRAVATVAIECAFLATTFALLSIPLPQPFNYYAALALLVVIPGHGFPRLMFGRALSNAEAMLFTVLVSIGLTTGSVFGLLLVGVRLDAEVLRATVIALAAVSSCAALMGVFIHRSEPAQGMPVGDAAAFALGLFVSTAVGVGMMNLL